MVNPNTSQAPPYDPLNECECKVKGKSQVHPGVTHQKNENINNIKR